jgi:hypothetical protein
VQADTWSMLLLVSVLALLAAVGVTVRWTLTRVDELGRTSSFPVISTVLALGVAVAAGIPVLRHHQLEARLGAVSSDLAGRRVSVRCETLSQSWIDSHAEMGYVRFDEADRPEPVATLTVQACQDLSSWLSSNRVRPSLAQVVAVHVLTHEAMHLRGQRNEALAECSAVQRDARTAALLGATPGQADALARIYWTTVYSDLPEDYRTAQCATGGPLDEQLPSPPWVAVKGG